MQMEVDRMKLVEYLKANGLSKAEVSVAEQVCRGLSNVNVGKALYVTDKTVKYHLTNIYKKMHVKSRAELIISCMPFMPTIPSVQREQHA
jgi:DNA-binding NarL/FixJ family response regulator